jgi:coproporphyrinogen III oxidase
MFHGVLKAACDKHHKSYYHKFKEWCDKYFRISHRGITRGIGGIFFDDLDKPNQDKCFQFVSDLGKTTIPCYLPIVRKQKDAPYGYEERQWQLIRRGHYTEFNLVYDRGTKFGLYTPGARYINILS